jgi:phytoene desaturase
LFLEMNLNQSGRTLIVGAGIGGLSAAIHLAAAGKKVVVLEQNPQVGGKMGEIRQAGYRWDTGPSLITMRPVFEDLFRAGGHRLEDFLDLRPLEPLARVYFADGVRLDVTRSLPEMLEQIRRIQPTDVAGYLAFLAYVARLYRIVSPLFIFDQPPRLGSLLKVSPLDALRFDGLRTMSQAIGGFVHSAHLRQLLGIFATYVGASPYLAPATLNVIAHVELNQGLWYPAGGVYQIAQVYSLLAHELNVEIRASCRAQAIDVRSGRVRGVVLESGEYLPASAVISNLDVALTYEKLLPAGPVFHRRLAQLQQADLSCSAFVILLGVRGLHPELEHHTTFFSADYRQEFDEIFRQKIPPTEPTIYVSISARSTPEDAPPGCENWFIQINVPALSPTWEWRTQAEAYADRILDLIAQRGVDLRAQIETRHLITPLDLERLTGARRGALYGTSSNNRGAAFRRPHNRAPNLRGLYFAGGTTHPGGGVPMVTLSGKFASELLLKDGY